MKKKKLKYTIALLIALLAVWWLFPRPLAPPADTVSSIHIGNGLTGHGRTLENPAEVQALLAQMQNIKTIRTLPQFLPSGGYHYVLLFYGENGETVKELVVHSGGSAVVGHAHVHLTNSVALSEILDQVVNEKD